MFSFIRHRINQYNDARTATLRYRELRKYITTDGGFFVEAGGYDGRTQSNSYGLERWAGWRGILVEPIPELAAQCRRRRPLAAVEEMALVAESYPATTVAMRYAGSMSLVRGCHPNEDHAVMLGTTRHNVATYEIDVAATTLSALLDKHKVTNPDFVSLDAEGYELEILRGLDLSKHAPQWLLIETGDSPEVAGYLEGRYEPIVKIEMDMLWKRLS